MEQKLQNQAKQKKKGPPSVHSPTTQRKKNTLNVYEHRQGPDPNGQHMWLRTADNRQREKAIETW